MAFGSLPSVWRWEPGPSGPGPQCPVNGDGLRVGAGDGSPGATAFGPELTARRYGQWPSGRRSRRDVRGTTSGSAFRVKRQRQRLSGRRRRRGARGKGPGHGAREGRRLMAMTFGSEPEARLLGGDGLGVGAPGSSPVARIFGSAPWARAAAFGLRVEAQGQERITRYPGVAVLASIAGDVGVYTVPRGKSQESIEPAVGLTAAVTQRTRPGEQGPEVELASQPHRRGLRMTASRLREVSPCSLHKRR